MAFAGRIAYAERRRVNEIDDQDIRQSSPVESATAMASEERGGGADPEHKAFVEQTERLLQCPCLDGLREGPCGNSFKDAFKCFILSKDAEKGAECAQEFTSLEMCLLQNKETFQKAESKSRKQDAKLPKIPGQNLKFPPKIVEWSKEKD